MKRKIDRIYELNPAEVVKALRWYLTYRELRMPNDDKSCSVEMDTGGGAMITFTEEVQETEVEPGELRWGRRGVPVNATPPTVSTDG